MDWSLLSLAALGAAAAFSPCPLAANIAAAGFISRHMGSRREALASALLYALGRILAYVLIGLLIGRGLSSAPGLSFWLQEELPVYLGPVMMAAGLVMLDLLPFFSLGAKPDGETIKRLTERWRTLGALALGFLFALAMCPPSAALFFGTALPLSLQTGGQKAWLGISLFGLGTALPVTVFSLLLLFSAEKTAAVMKRLPKIQRAVKLATGWLFLLLGGYWLCSRILFV